MKKEMLINVMQPEECRIAIIEDGVLEELYVERTSHESYVGNIYKGRIVNIEPSIQAAFVDFGVGRNGFLHVSDVEPAYYRHLETRRGEDRRGEDRGGRRGPSRGRGGDRDRGRGRDQDRGRRRPRSDEEYRQPVASDYMDLGDDEDLGTAATQAEMYEAPTEESPIAETPEDPLAPPTERAAEETPGRGRSRRRRTEEPSAEPTESNEPREPDSDWPGKPRLMDSAERRTEEDDSEPSSAAVPDEDIFFPRSEDSPRPPAEPPTHSASDFVETDLVEEPVGSPSPRENWQAPPPTEAVEEMGEFVETRFTDFDEEEPTQRRPQRNDQNRRPGGRDRGRRPGGGRPGMGRPKPLIQDIFKRGQEVLVQVIKEGIGTKGPTLSTYISIAGRYLVLMPGLNRVGVSRKIADDDQRRRLRDIFHELQPPKGLGFIIRTAGLDKTKKELQRDLAYLSRLWQVVVRRIRKVKTPAEIYQESDMITRTIRDTFTNDIDTIWVDEPSHFEHAQEFCQIVMPRYASRIKLYDGAEPMFHKHGIEDEIQRIQQRHVPLPSGGSIVIDQTEALVAIDVNSGNFRADNNAEETAYQMNLQAAKEIARQLRLRDLGGVIVNDFIDMREEKHRRGVEKAMRDAVKRDRARTKILKISQFGLIEMTRQRIRPSLKRSVYQDCPHCHNTGQVKTCESMSIDVMRMIQLAAHRPNISRVQIKVADEVANYLLNKKRKEIVRLEETGEIAVTIVGHAGVSPETLDFLCFDNNNNEVKFPNYEEPSRPRRR